MKYLLKFVGGKQIKVEEKDATLIDEQWNKNDSGKQVIQLPDGSSARLSTLMEIEPVREHREASDLTAVGNMQKIADYLDNTEANYKDGRRKMIEAYMKGKNHQRKFSSRPI